MGLNQKKAAHLAAIFTVSVWGATFISTKVLLRQLTPVEILVVRAVLALFVLCIVNPKRMQIKERRHELYFLVAGMTGPALYFLCENIALQYGDASIIGVVISSAPLFAGIFAAIFLKEKITHSFIVGFGVAIAGVCLISLGGSAASIRLPGIVLSLVAAMIWGAYSTLISKISAQGYSALDVTKRTFIYAVLFLLPIAGLSGFRVQAVLTADPAVFGNLLFLGVGASAFCFLIWNFAIRTLGAAKTTAYIYASPVMTVILAALLLHERMNARGVVGMILVLVGLALSEGRLSGKETVHGTA